MNILNLLKIDTSQYVEPTWYMKHIPAKLQGLLPQSAATARLKIERAIAKRERKAAKLNGTHLKSFICNPCIDGHALGAALGRMGRKV